MGKYDYDVAWYSKRKSNWLWKNSWYWGTSGELNETQLFRGGESTLIWDWNQKSNCSCFEPRKRLLSG